MRGARGCRGLALVTLIVLLAVALIATAGITSAVVEGMQATFVQRNLTKAMYLAQAGVMDAVESYQSTGPSGWSDAFRLGPFLVPGGPSNERFIRSGPQRDFLFADMRSAQFTRRLNGAQSTFDDWRLQRVLQPPSTSPTSLWISRIKVFWSGAPTARVTKLIINANVTISCPGPAGSFCLDGLSRASGDPIDITPPFELTGNAVLANNHIWFNTNLQPAGVRPASVTLVFYMSDSTCDEVTSSAIAFDQLPVPRLEDCQRMARWRNDATIRDAHFTVRATGEVDAAPFLTRRYLRAEYGRMRGSDTDQILLWREVGFR